MKNLIAIHRHGEECSRRTGWATWSGFSLAVFDDTTTKYFSENVSDVAILSECQKLGIGVAGFIAKQGEAVRGYPPKPEGATEYQHNYGYEVPVGLGEWAWSTTFGRWGRHVTFSDGWAGFTYPKNF